MSNSIELQTIKLYSELFFFILFFCIGHRDIFSLGFGPFRWVCTSGDPRDLAVTDDIAATVLEEISANVNDNIRQQYDDNIHWIREAGKHNLVGNSLGSQCLRLLPQRKSSKYKETERYNLSVFILFV